MEYRNNYVAAAGRAIMDLMQSEWEPLSYWELDQRLDRAVEEMLEADFMAQAQGESSSVFEGTSSTQDQTQTVTLQLTPESGLPVSECSSEHPDPTEGHPAVKVRLLT